MLSYVQILIKLMEIKIVIKHNFYFEKKFGPSSAKLLSIYTTHLQPTLATVYPNKFSTSTYLSNV